MKKIFTLTSIAALTLLTYTVKSQNAFHKGSLLVSLSEGNTIGAYSTCSNTPDQPHPINTDIEHGTRDPLIIEYGLSNRWSIGLTSGADIWNVRSSLYGFNTPKNSVTATTSELTVDVGFHVYTNKRLDLSVVGSHGFGSVMIKGGDGDLKYNYVANGSIIRYGTRVRYYLWKRFGVFGMVSGYTANYESKGVKGNTFGKNYCTSISGMAVEMGLCFRFF